VEGMKGMGGWMDGWMDGLILLHNKIEAEGNLWTDVLCMYRIATEHFGASRSFC
jgi:hypothetical protein